MGDGLLNVDDYPPCRDFTVKVTKVDWVRLPLVPVTMPEQRFARSATRERKVRRGRVKDLGGIPVNWPVDMVIPIAAHHERKTAVEHHSPGAAIALIVGVSGETETGA